MHAESLLVVVLLLDTCDKHYKMTRLLKTILPVKSRSQTQPSARYSAQPTRFPGPTCQLSMFFLWASSIIIGQLLGTFWTVGSPVSRPALLVSVHTAVATANVRSSQPTNTRLTNHRLSSQAASPTRSRPPPTSPTPVDKRL